MFQAKVVEKIKIHFSCSKPFFENDAVYEITWKSIVEPDRPQMKIWHMCIACCIPKAIHTHTEYVTLIAFPLQQCLQEGASMLLDTHTACIVMYYFHCSLHDFHLSGAV